MSFVTSESIRELTKTEEVLIHHCVPNEPLLRWLDEIVVLDRVILRYEVDGRAKGEEASEEQNHERFDIREGRDQQFDVERRIVEQS